MINIGDLIDDRYKIKATLGKGGMSEVYEAYDIVLKKTVALKILNEASRNNPENLIRFENEARIAASLFHPNIVRIYNYQEYKDTYFIVNEYQKGQTLKDYLAFKSYLPLKEACQIMIQILDALSFMHQKGIIHRDIKPQNIFYGSDGIAKVSDFGISIIKDEVLNVDEYKKVVGTAQYLAPELIKGSRANEQSDIYSAGVTFFELLSGYLPFDDDNVNKVAMAHVKEEFPSILKYMPTLPKSVDEIIKKAVSKDLSYRYKSASDMLDDVIDLYKDKKVIRKSTRLIDRIFGKWWKN